MVIIASYIKEIGEIMPSQTKRPIAAEELYRLEHLDDARISPDGRTVVYCVTRVDRETEKKYSNLWIVPVAAADPEAGQARAFTTGDQTDTNPRWSPDGRTIAFLSDRGGSKQRQIYLLPIDGGEARRLTDWPGDFGPFEWAPDGRRLVCQFRKKDQAAIERESDPAKKERGIVARRINRLIFRLEGSGYLPEERWHVWTVDVGSGESRQLTDGDVFDELTPRWSPDGKEIAFLSNRSPDPDLDVDAVDLFVISAEEAEEASQWRKIETPVGNKWFLSYSPDGRWLAYIGREGRRSLWQNHGLWVVPADGKGTARNLTAAHDIHVASATMGDFADRATVRPLWFPDSRRILFQVTRHGNTTLMSTNVDAGDDLQPVADIVGVCGAFSLDAGGQSVACIVTTQHDPGQVWLWDLIQNRKRQLTRANERLLAELDLGSVEEVWFPGAAGHDLQGWILKPPAFDPSKTYPSILEIHGGPWGQYGNCFMHEFYYLAAQGFVVFYCNPRGGQGYGEAHSKAIHHQWGTADFDDLMAWTDYVAQQPYIDRERMGVTGGSYGGFMTAWIIGHTGRFQAAVAQRVVSNTISFVGSSDINWTFQEVWSAGVRPWEDFEQYWRQSPLAHIGNAKTPTLVLHSEQDLRCNLEQGLQLFVALKQLGVESELVLFPEESHGLSRTGRTDRRVARLEHMRRWFDRYLKPYEPLDEVGGSS